MGQHEQLFCSLDGEGGPGMGGTGPHGIQSYRPDNGGRTQLPVVGQ
jgi:nitrate reductase beta subunit